MARSTDRWTGGHSLVTTAMCTGRFKASNFSEAQMTFCGFGWILVPDVRFGGQI
jgi:hypothetical protein